MDNKIIMFQVSSLEKVYLDYKKPQKEINRISLLKNEKTSYQVAYMAKDPYTRRDMKIAVKSPLEKYISVRQVGNVPVECPVRADYDDYYERYSPGIFPDVLYPIENNTIEVLNGTWHSLWVTITLDGSAQAGKYPITISFSDGEITESKTISAEVIDAYLPDQELIFTQWLHTDCIADYYKIPVFSQEHWIRIEQFVKTATQNGINMILTPLFTPPLDTQVGGERTTVQLVDITKNGNEYEFGFDKLRRYIKLCRKHGVKYFEICHLFTQWGLEFTPKVMAIENGIEKRIFGWDVRAEDERYLDFLSKLLPELDKVLKDEGISENTFFHISDEPYAEHVERYKMLKEKITSVIPGYTFIDALSDYNTYIQGGVDKPIPATNNIAPFIENNVSDLWCYYCCSQAVNVCNRFMAMPSYRNRLIGLQFYKFDIKGFLHWGYNFYNSALSKKHIDPFKVTDAINTYQSGDAFSVYPGEEGPIESLRLLVFYDALQDLRALKLLEKYIGKEKTIALIEEEAQMEITFDSYPHSMEFMLNLREKINREIAQYVK